MIRRPPRSTQSRSSAASDVYKRQLEAGKHTFVEKPIALKASDAEDLLTTADAKGVKLMVGHLLEYHPAVRKLKELVDDGSLGKVYYVYANRLNLGKAVSYTHLRAH